MSQILKDLYYGNINPNEKPFAKDSEYAKELKSICEIEEKLSKLLNEEEKKLFNQFSDAHGNMNRITVVDSFVDGFCLGMQLAVAVFHIAKKE